LKKRNIKEENMKLEVSYQIDKERVKVKKMRVLYQLFDKA
jgi:hypothetical protein